jgi:hypothetical protein
MDEFLDTYNLLKLNQEVVSNLNRSSSWEHISLLFADPYFFLLFVVLGFEPRGSCHAQEARVLPVSYSPSPTVHISISCGQDHLNNP